MTRGGFGEIYVDMNTSDNALFIHDRKSTVVARLKAVGSSFPPFRDQDDPGWESRSFVGDMTTGAYCWGKCKRIIALSRRRAVAKLLGPPSSRIIRKNNSVQQENRHGKDRRCMHSRRRSYDDKKRRRFAPGGPVSRTQILSSLPFSGAHHGEHQIHPQQ